MISYLELFITIFKINIMTFGGGYTIAPVMLDEFAKKRQLINEDEMLDIIALAQSGPGALAVSVSLLIGYKLKGIKGALVCIAGAVLPPLVVISIIYFFYKEFASNFWVRAALRGMGGMIAAVLVATTFDLGKSASKKRPVFAYIIIVGTFIVSYLTDINTAFIILALAIIGAVLFSIKGIDVK